MRVNTRLDLRKSGMGKETKGGRACELDLALQAGAWEKEKMFKETGV